MEEMELFQMNTALVKRNIEYDCLVQRCRLGEQQQLDEIVALIVGNNQHRTGEYYDQWSEIPISVRKKQIIVAGRKPHRVCT